MQRQPPVGDNHRRRSIFKSIFIDGSFLFHCAQHLNVRIDYRKLKQVLTQPGDHISSICYYTALPNELDLGDAHRAFLRLLKKELKIRVRSVPLLSSPTKDDSSVRYSKGEDILLACDMVRGAYLDYYDVAILVSGDGDFVPAIQQVLEQGKQVIIASFKQSLSHSLDLESTQTIYLDDFLTQIQLQQPEKAITPVSPTKELFIKKNNRPRTLEALENRVILDPSLSSEENQQSQTDAYTDMDEAEGS